MYTGSVGVTGRVALFVEFLDSRTKRYESEREVASESTADLLAAGLPTHAIGFRFFTRVVAEARTPFGPRALSGSHLETGPRHIIGTLVSRAYLSALLPDPPINIGTLATLVGHFDTDPGIRMARIDLREYQVLQVGDIVVDPSGAEVTETLGAPEGWTPVTEFTGRSFYLDVMETLLSVRSFGEGANEAEVYLNVAFPLPGLPAAIQAAAHGQDADVDSSRGILTLRAGANLRIPIADRVLQLGFDGKTLHAELSAS